MATFTFLHAADLHLDTPFEGLGRVDPDLAEELRDASLRAFERLVDLALERRVAFVVFAGDIYDGAERGLRAQLRFRRGLARLSDAEIPSFIVHGNHDPLGEGWSAISEWPHRVHVFSSGEVEAVPVEIDGARIATVHGTSFGRRAETENLARRFRRGAEGGIHVGVLHCNVEGQAEHDPYAPCSLEDLRSAGLDYWALGHVHTRQTLLQGQSWAAYPGNLQGRSFKPAEQGAKGALLIQVEDDAVRQIEFCSLAPVIFASIPVDISGLEDLAQLADAMIERAARVAAEAGGIDGLLVRAELRGRGPLHGELGQRLEELRLSLDDATGGGSPWIRWDRLERSTHRAIDRERLGAREDLVGEVLRSLDGLRADPKARRAIYEEVDQAIRKGTLQRFIEPLGDEALLDLLDGVEQEALDRLEVEADPGDDEQDATGLLEVGS